MIEDGFLDADLRPCDRLGRVVPHRMNVLTFMRSINGFANRFVTVPESYYESSEGGKVAVVDCPCGNTVAADVAEMVPCPECGRVYVWAVKRLVVGNSPAGRGVSMSG